MDHQIRRRGLRSARVGRAEALWVASLACAVGSLGVATVLATPPTTLRDFLGPGTQPNQLALTIAPSQNCDTCHGSYDPAHEPLETWRGSMMAQASRDPLFYACLAVANQDAPFAGELCLRCHTPGAWLDGRCTPPDGSALDVNLGDFDGVTCHLCHRMVDPWYDPGVSPPEDEAILNALFALPVNPHNGQWVIDPQDRRRGPYDLGNFPIHGWLESPFHRDAAMCGMCHDVSNPVFTRQPDGSYDLNDFNAEHPTHDKYDEFPLERTYSEWLASDFAVAPIDMGGRFGGLVPEVSTCQDCHMPDANAAGCSFVAPRGDLGVHTFAGATTWVLQAVRNLYPDLETGLTDTIVADSIARNIEFLGLASDLELYPAGPVLTARVINQTGHKIPTGFPEGRRIWVNVQFKDLADQIIAERGHYDSGTAVLTGGDTRVYEAQTGLDAHAAAATGLPEGFSYHAAVTNIYVKDNRIPPRGFTNAGFEAVQAGVIGHTYADGQYWDDVSYQIPVGAASVTVNVYYQTVSKEYVEFLFSEDTTTTHAATLHTQWLANDKGPPILMDTATIDLCLADFDGDGDNDGIDVGLFLQAYGTGGPLADMDGDGDTDGIDVGLFLQAYGTGC